MTARPRCCSSAAVCRDHSDAVEVFGVRCKQTTLLAGTDDPAALVPARRRAGPRRAALPLRGMRSGPAIGLVATPTRRMRERPEGVARRCYV
jgi:hypothetical protein